MDSLVVGLFLVALLALVAYFIRRSIWVRHLEKKGLHEHTGEQCSGHCPHVWGITEGFYADYAQATCGYYRTTLRVIGGHKPLKCKACVQGIKRFKIPTTPRNRRTV
jgi:hypothetical protein